jgi:hypothetical protein
MIKSMLFWDKDAAALAEKLAAAFSSDEELYWRRELLKSVEPLVNGRVSCSTPLC